jgi:hypothetical protein
MKPNNKDSKILCLFLGLMGFVFMTFSPCRAQDKCFSKGNFAINAGVGFSLYRYTAQLKSDRSSETNLAVSRIGRLSIEHAFKNYWSMGVLGKRNIYITEVDSATGKKPDIFSYDLLLFSNLHFVRSKHVNMLWGLGYGFSTFTYNTRDQQISQATGTGGSFETNLTKKKHCKKLAAIKNCCNFVLYFNNYIMEQIANRKSQIANR